MKDLIKIIKNCAKAILDELGPGWKEDIFREFIEDLFKGSLELRFFSYKLLCFFREGLSKFNLPAHSKLPSSPFFLLSVPISDLGRRT